MYSQQLSRFERQVDVHESRFSIRYRAELKQTNNRKQPTDRLSRSKSVLCTEDGSHHQGTSTNGSDNYRNPHAFIEQQKTKVGEVSTSLTWYFSVRPQIYGAELKIPVRSTNDKHGLLAPCRTTTSRSGKVKSRATITPTPSASSALKTFESGWTGGNNLALSTKLPRHKVAHTKPTGAPRHTPPSESKNTQPLQVPLPIPLAKSLGHQQSVAAPAALAVFGHIAQAETVAVGHLSAAVIADLQRCWPSH